MLCTEQWVKERVDYWWQLLAFGYCTTEEDYGRMGNPPSVAFDKRMTSCAGRAYSFLKCIKFSAYYMAHIDPHLFDRTVAHEVAHVWVDNWYHRKCNHGPRWKHAMYCLGLPPARCHNYRRIARIRAAAQKSV